MRAQFRNFVCRIADKLDTEDVIDISWKNGFAVIHHRLFGNHWVTHGISPRAERDGEARTLYECRAREWRYLKQHGLTQLPPPRMDRGLI